MINKIEIVAIEDAKSMTEGYNRAMKKTDAKYKVYFRLIQLNIFDRMY